MAAVNDCKCNQYCWNYQALLIATSAQPQRSNHLGNLNTDKQKSNKGWSAKDSE
jgi:hypothetical protein